MKIELIENESGDWVIVKKDGKVYHEGHDVPNHIWLELLNESGVESSSSFISDEDMEEGNF